jgi:hypothetical protein
LEREADRAADAALRAPADTAAQRATPQRPHAAPVRASPADGIAGDAGVARVTASPGVPLPGPVRRGMEARFGHRFDAVRVHTGPLAEGSAAALDAHAYTAGSHIAFAAGRYAPHTPAGERLLAHELAHTIQQGASPALDAPGPAPVRPRLSRATAGAPPIQRQDGGTATVPASPTSGAATPAAPAAAPDPCAEAVTETRDQAIDRLDAAYRQLISFDAGEVFAQPGDTPDPEQERIRRTLQRSFHTDDLAYVEVIRRRVLHMASTLRARQVTVACASAGDPHCRGGGSGFTAAYVERPYAMVLCSLGTPGSRPVETFVHELAHAVVPEVGVSSTRASLTRGVRDRAYDHERLFRYMTVEEALDNAESYGLLVEQLATRTDVDVARSPVDTAPGCTDAAAPVTAIARFELWNRDVGRLLAALIHFITSPTPQLAFADLPQDELDRLARHFPAVTDLAGLRSLKAFYERMANALSIDLAVACATAGGTCGGSVLGYSPKGSVTASTVTLRTRRLTESMFACPDWFTASSDDRVGALYALFILSRPDWMTSGIALADVFHYVNFAREASQEITPAPAASGARQHLGAAP